MRLTLTIRMLATSLIAMLLLCVETLRADEVVVYTSLDQVFSEPVLRAFEAETGIE